MIPGAEVKFGVAYALYNIESEWSQAFLIAITENMFLVPFGLKFF